ncbi:energy transducer TonB [Hymenobacter sp. BT664]|uniref:Energy transducer TonB n=1 Tax=Hymenobacter montanus TaxID=2771359 RepID=A0A927BCW2_9BACT|nr:energy transducer TonB [Hymenobacter montanus]MBD2768151.1 energy transducer TonB [Hymenobacter montanus]
MLEQGSTTADGRRIGKWNFYTSKQELELTYDYDSSRITFRSPDTTRYLVRTGDSWVPQRLDRAPHVLGSSDQRLQDLQRNLRYPGSALREQLQGTVVIGYTVDVTGHTKDFTVESSMSPDCDQEVWRVLTLLPDNWICAIQNGRPTPSRFYLAVRFEMMDEASFDRVQRESKRLVQSPGSTAPPPPPARPHYAHEVVVTALAIERGTRREYLSR